MNFPVDRILLVAGFLLPQSLSSLSPVPFDAVRIEDSFFAPRIRTLRAVTLPLELERCEETGRLTNFRRAAGLEPGPHQGALYNDSDVYKILQGIAESLALEPDPPLRKRAEKIIGWIAAAQEPDGYLDTYNQLVLKGERWKDLQFGHELYCAGHLIEAAIAWHRATGEENLLGVARRLADLLVATFGEGKRLAAPGHQEIEMALLALSSHLGEPRYADLARRFLLARGDSVHRTLYGAYAQDLRPVLETREVSGHAVRATYQFCAMADLARLEGGGAWTAVLRSLWNDVRSRRMYVTGGIGSTASNEGFGAPFELPNRNAYCETCASVGMSLWARRMFLLTGEAPFVDVLERELYNNVLAGISLSGDRFFYDNPLASPGGKERVPWFQTSCCPTNLARTLPALGDNLYARRGRELYLLLYVSSRVAADLEGGPVLVRQGSGLPFEGKVRITLDARSSSGLTLRLRRPDWCLQEPRIELDGKPWRPAGASEGQGFSPPGSFLSLPLEGGRIHEVFLELPLEARRLHADPRVASDRGRVAIQRGPLIYCLEGRDNGGSVSDAVLPPDRPLVTGWNPQLLGGIATLKAKGRAVLRRGGKRVVVERSLVLIPYALWANRGADPMEVWIPEQPSLAVPSEEAGGERVGDVLVTASFCNASDSLAAVTDGILPNSSSDESIPRQTFWNHLGTREWIQFTFDAPRVLSEANVYWFDDTGHGGCRLPAEWSLSVQTDEGWRPIEPLDGSYPVGKNRFDRVRFEKVETDAIRLEVQLQKGFSGGILEWTLSAKKKRAR